MQETNTALKVQDYVAAAALVGTFAFGAFQLVKLGKDKVAARLGRTVEQIAA